jgi:hypothetical protein
MKQVRERLRLTFKNVPSVNSGIAVLSPLRDIVLELE